MFSVQSQFNQKTKIIILIVLLFLFVGVSGYFVKIKSEYITIENQSLSVAEIVARQASAARSIYAKEIFDTLKKDNISFFNKEFHDQIAALPIPAQFFKNMASNASDSSDGIYKYRAVSKWNLGTDQDLNNDFLKYAWEMLERQDKANPTKAIDWKPVYRVEPFEGKETLLYLRADPASDASCANCHSNFEKQTNIINRRLEQNIPQGKSWKQHQLLGAIFVQIPVENMKAIASKNSKLTMLWIICTLIIGLGALAFFFLKDIIKAKNVTKQLFWQAKHDTLTKLPNRQNFEENTKALIDDASSNVKTHALCFLDLDQFKLVNDTCGHAAGDQLLCEVTDTLLNKLGDNSFLARLGGDEFGLLLRECDLEEANLIAQELCKTIKEYKFSGSGHSFEIGVSIGVVEINHETLDIDHLMSCADFACYAAKDSGRNRVKNYTKDDEILNLRKDEMTWVSAISKALNENRIVIYSQKIGSVVEGKDYSHHEILVRLINEEGEIVYPDKFIPAAERYNLMIKLDLAIIDRAFSALKNKYFKDLGENGFISINLSGNSLSDASFLKEVKLRMMKYRINPAQVCFEITESSAMENKNLVLLFIKEMKALKVKFALDDFGTGLSSLTYLKQFPVDYLKIDGSFIKDIVNDPVDRSVVEAISNMANTMGLKTIAEYVESKEIFKLLHTMKIDYVQGYFVQKPCMVELDFDDEKNPNPNS